MATTISTRQHRSRRHSMMAIGAALTLGAVAGVGSWQVGLYAYSSGRTPAALTLRAPAQQSAERPMTTVPNTAAAGAARHERLLYLVDSDADTEALRASLGYISDPTIVPDVTVTVLPQSSPAAGDMISWLIRTENESGRLQDLPPLQVVDLRSLGAAATQSDSE